MSAILNNTTEELAVAHKEAQAAGNRAAQEYLDKNYGGQDASACGFAWCIFHPSAKGNTKIGKAERQLIESAGFRKDWTGKAWQLWNPADHRCQNVDAKYHGATVYAKRFEELTGVKLSVGDRLD